MKKLTHHYTSSYYNRCDLIISPSKSLSKELFEHKIKKPVKVIPNSVYLDRIKVDKKKEYLKKQLGLEGKKVIIYFGRVSKEKSIDVLIDAFKLTTNEFDNIRLMIVGDGPAMNDLKKRTKKLGVSDKVIFTGMLSGKKLWETVASGDVFSSASTSENQPMSFIEAMALGLPMVCADAKGAPELCHNGKNGLLFSPGNKQDLAKKLIEILKDPEIIKKMSKASEKYANNYSNKYVIDELINDYRKLIKEKSAK